MVPKVTFRRQNNMLWADTRPGRRGRRDWIGYAEPIIVETLLRLLEQVAGKQRRLVRIHDGPYAKAILAAKPIAYWRCDEMVGNLAVNRLESTNARLEDGVALQLPGVRREGGGVATPPETDSPFTGTDVNRAWHIAGGRMRAESLKLGKSYSASLWFWNGLPHDAKPVTGLSLFSRTRWRPTGTRRTSGYRWQSSRCTGRRVVLLHR